MQGTTALFLVFVMFIYMDTNQFIPSCQQVYLEGHCYPPSCAGTDLGVWGPDNGPQHNCVCMAIHHL